MTLEADKAKINLDSLVIRFAGDSGDGMQVTGDRFTAGSAILGNDVATFPNYPAEIRAPAGTIAGVSAFQVQIADHDIYTPGDFPTVLVAMNPAALKANIADLPPGGVVICNSDAFDQRSLEKAGYAANPLEDGSLDIYKLYGVPITSLTLEACKGIGAKPRDAERSKNFFALGLVSWLYDRPYQPTLDFIRMRYAKNSQVVEANTLAFNAGRYFGETAEVFESSYTVPASKLPPGEYTNITGNTALSWGLIAAARQASLPMFLGSYPITPASDILHELSKHKAFDVTTFQAEDEIAAVCSALGAAFGGAIGVTTTSGPGIDLKSETVGLAVSLELPLVIIDIQRGGPSTGLPTKTEQSDLLHVMFGRHGEAPVPIVAAATPAHCFEAATEAVRIALTYRTPVYLLSDGYLANGAEPFRIPAEAELPEIKVEFATKANKVLPDGREVFWPYLRDEKTLARPWALPGTKGLEHRIGGIEKADGSGNISYDPLNHELMVQVRQAKVEGISKDLPDLEVDDPDQANVLVMGWGSTYGTIVASVNNLRQSGYSIARAHLMYLNPFPRNLADVLSKYDKVLIPEMNSGQLAFLIRSKFLKNVTQFNKIQGVPFKTSEIEAALITMATESK
ncbi:MAG: 2-oxoacid:acceptor oxidoreductase subunit alpha [Firmicutes bacterium]|nr:2-oxoacid:acceptor oxidoreductase subunit alpha [Bacillota bacterium]